MSALLQLQQEFSRCSSLFLVELHNRGYNTTEGDAYRDPRAAFPYCQRTSLHFDRLARDINLFRNGIWLQTVDEWKEAGELWEAFHPLARWGGRFKSGDANHISFEWQGRR